MALDLEKRTGKLTLSLTKRNIAKINVQVGNVVDRSGSMDPLYKNGTVQEYILRLVPMGLKFDDNGQIDSWAFTERSHATGAITADNAESYVSKKILPITSGCTSFAPVLSDIYKHYFGDADSKATAKKPGLFSKLFGSSTPEKTEAVTVESPVYLIFQTDGDNDDKYETDELLKKLESKGIYIQFVGVGGTSFSFLERMADKYSNVGFFTIRDLERTSDEVLYDLLINDEFKTFLKTRFPNNIQEIN